MGAEELGRRVLRAKQWIELRHSGFWSRKLLRIFGFFFGFGYSSRRALATLLTYFVIGWGGVWLAQEYGALIYDLQPIASHAQLGNKKGEYTAVMMLGSGIEDLHCSDIDAYSYALDLMIPLIDLHTEGKCEVRRDRDEPDIYGTPVIRAGLEYISSRLFKVPPHSFKFVLPHATQIWRAAHTVYAMLGWLVVSLSILTFSGLLRQKEYKS